MLLGLKLKEGDKNAKYLQASPNQRRSRMVISLLMLMVLKLKVYGFLGIYCILPLIQ
jgi:hypothetical protein